MAHPNERTDSGHGISRDAIVWRLDQLEKGQAAINETLSAISITLAKLPAVCPRADQCVELAADVKSIQEDRYKAKGSLWAIGIVCTFLGFVISQINSVWHK